MPSLQTRAVALSLVLLMSFVVYFKGEFFVSWDLSNYLTYADALIDRGYAADPAGKPVDTRLLYVLSLAGVQALFGKSMLAISAFHALLAALLATMVYVTATTVFPRKLAVGLWLVFLLTPGLVFRLPRHIDPVWPTLCLGALACLIRGSDANVQGSRQAVWFAAAGGLVAAGVLVKMMSALLLLVLLAQPLLLGLRRGAWMTAIALAGFLATYVALSAALGTLSVPQTASRTADAHLSMLVDRIGGVNPAGLWRLAVLSAEGLYAFFMDTRGIIGIAPVWPVGLFGLIIAALAAFGSPAPEARGATGALRGLLASLPARARTGAGQLVLTALAFAPFAVYCGMWLLRPSQNLMLVAALFVAIGFPMWLVLDWLSRRRAQDPSGLIGHGVVAGLGLLLLAVQLPLTSTHLANELQKNYLARVLIEGEFGFESRLRGEAVARWIDRNVDHVAGLEDGLFVSYEPATHGVYYALDRDIQITFVPWRNAAGLSSPYYADLKDGTGRPALLATYGWRPPRPITTMYFLSASDFRASMRETGIRTIAIARNPMGRRLQAWLDHHVGLEELATVEAVGWDTDIYRISGNAIGEMETLSVDRRIAPYLRFIEETEPWRSEPMLQRTFADNLGLEADQIEQVLNAEEDGDGLFLEIGAR